MQVSVPQRAPKISDEQLFNLVKELVRDQHFKELRSALERQRYIQKKLGVERRAIDGVGAPVMELDPFLAHAIKQVAADADGTVHNAALSDPTMLRLLKRDGIEVGVKDCGTTTARVGFRQTVDYSYQQPADSGQRREESGGRIRFRKTYATA
jgi:hypothetical protein